MQNEQNGILYVVATPIGNLQDITLRAIEVLKSVDKIAAEDTRHAAPLLKHYSIRKPMFSMHEFNERDRLHQVIESLQQGESVALISDAGTPLISDPGFRLVREAKEQGIRVVPIPGACAGMAALSAAGLPSDRFTFEGFLSAKQEARVKQLTLLAHEARTIIFYEAPHRLLATLKSMAAVFGAARKASVARELTKVSVITDTLKALVDYYEVHTEEQRGEIVILVEGINEEVGASTEVLPAQVLDVLLDELPLKQAVSLASKITGERKNILYDMALTKGRESGSSKGDE
jgi:16S rRNA (cytidine1402-2'-O)-methyltransferase